MKSTILAAFMIAATFNVSLAQQTWKVDPAHSQIGFTVEHMVISEVNGLFSDFDITVNTQDDSFEAGDIQVDIKAGSIETGVEKRDNHLKSEDFFNVEKYPTITFTSSALEKTGDKTYKLKGDLTIHGITKPVVLTVTHNGTITGPYGKTRAGFKITGTINRFDYGLEWNSLMEAGGAVVGEEVEIVANVELIKQ